MKRKKWRNPIMEPTLNSTGFMFKVLDEYAQDFIEYAGQIDDPVLEIGCAFGNVTIPALEAGGQVTACDLEQQHLDILADKTPPELSSRLQCVQGQLPYVDFPQAQFGAVLCSRVLHFLDGSAIDASVRKMYSWVKPGGRLYLIIDTPYGIWRKLIPIFEAKKERGDRWPGLMIGLENYLPFVPADRSLEGPPFMNLLDPDILTRVCTEAGFEVERAGFIDRSDFGGLGRMDGRENAGIIAHRPE
ncbi:MAG: class I SAM-dependent methyltransferase [Gammaproteobacteria bacterium]